MKNFRKIILIYFFIYSTQLLSINTIKSSQSESGLEFTMKKTNSDLSFNNNFVMVKSLDNKNTFELKGTSLLDLARMKDGLYTIKLTIGNPAQEFEVIVDTGSFLLWVPSSKCDTCFFNKNKLNEEKSISLIKQNEKLELRYISGRISGDVCFDQLKLNNGFLPKFKFLLSNYVNAPVKVDGIIGLSRKYIKYDSSFSIIDSLYKGGLIQRRMFSQKIDDNNDSDSKFTIGSLPKEIEDDLSNFTKCKAVTNNDSVNSYWTCNLNKVLFLKNNNTTEIDFIKEKTQALEVSSTTKPAIFDTGSNIIVAPLEFSDIFKDIFFKEFLDNGSCSVLNDYSGSIGFNCQFETDLNSLPTIKFVFDNNFIYDLSTKDLFIKSYNGYLFRIVFGQVPGNGWLLGQPFLKQYHIVFDQEDNTIGLFPKKKEGEDFKKIMNIVEVEIINANSNIEDSKARRISIFMGYCYISLLLLALCTVIVLKLTGASVFKISELLENNKAENIKSLLVNASFKNSL